MKLYLPGAAGFMLLAGVTAVAAQDVIIQPEQDVVIKEYVKKKPLASISLPGVELNIGSRIPDEVELHAVEVPDVEVSTMSWWTTAPCWSSPVRARSYAFRLTRLVQPSEARPRQRPALDKLSGPFL